MEREAKKARAIKRIDRLGNIYSKGVLVTTVVAGTGLIFDATNKISENTSDYFYAGTLASFLGLGTLCLGGSEIIKRRNKLTYIEAFPSSCEAIIQRNFPKKDKSES